MQSCYGKAGLTPWITETFTRSLMFILDNFVDPTRWGGCELETPALLRWPRDLLIYGSCKMLLMASSLKNIFWGVIWRNYVPLETLKARLDRALNNMM